MRAQTSASSSPAETLPGGSRREASWERHFSEVRRHVDTHGRLPRNTGGIRPDSDRLADWLSDQRKRRQRDLVTDYQSIQLSSLPGFEWDPIEARWSKTVQEYGNFLRATNGKRPQIRAHDPRERRLARWWSNHRPRALDTVRRQDMRDLLQLGSELHASQNAAA